MDALNAAVRDLVFGFPCLDWSSKRRKSTIRDGSHRTGRLFRAMVKYNGGDLGKDLDGVTAGNVIGLMDRPKARARRANRTTQTWTTVFISLKPRLISSSECASSTHVSSGTQSQGHAFWFICIPVAMLRAATVPREEATVAVHVLVSSFLAADVQRDLDDSLLPEGHPTLRRLPKAADVKEATRSTELEASRVASKSSASHSKRRNATWHRRHADRSGAVGRE